MVKIKIISDTDFIPLLELYIKMYSNIEDFSNVKVSEILHQELMKPNYTALGVYRFDELIGYLSGYGETEDTFFVSGLYCPTPLYVKRLFHGIENIMKDLGYKAWTTEYNKNDGKCLAPKFGAKEYIIKYKKEL